MRKRLILHETGFTLFFISYFIDGRVFFRMFTSYIVFDDLFLNWLFSTRVSDDRKHVCARRLYTCINTRKFKGLDSRDNYIIARDKKNVMDMARPLRLICLQWKFTTPNQLASPSKFSNQDSSFFRPLKCSLVLHNQPCAYIMHSLKHMFLYDRVCIHRESEDY